MRPRVLRRRILLAGLGAVIAGALLGTGIARATPETDFLDALTDRGIYVYDASTAVANGYDICAAFDRGFNGVDVARHLFENTTYSDVPTPEVAAVWVVAAGSTLCPWHWHPERSSAPATPDLPGSDVRISGGIGGVIE